MCFTSSADGQSVNYFIFVWLHVSNAQIQIININNKTSSFKWFKGGLHKRSLAIYRSVKALTLKKKKIGRQRVCSLSAIGHINYRSDFGSLTFTDPLYTVVMRNIISYRPRFVKLLKYNMSSNKIHIQRTRFFNILQSYSLNSSSSDSDSTTDDDFIIEVLQMLPRPRFFRDRSNPFTEYDDIDFIQRFGYL
jgi:hypothetical protein